MQEESEFRPSAFPDAAIHGAAMSANASSIEADLALYMPRLSNMSEQLKQTSTQIEDSVVAVCGSFQDIASRARATATRTTGFLSREASEGDGRQSFESLIESCDRTMVKLMKASAESGALASRAVERIQKIDAAARHISVSLGELEEITRGNKILALNARIEAVHSGTHGAGFAAVAVELASQTSKSQRVTSHVGDLTEHLRALADSTLKDLQSMQTEDTRRVAHCRAEVDETLVDLRAAHDQMKDMLNALTEEGALLANDIGSAVRGLQFQDRVSQRIAHVVTDLTVMQERIAARINHVTDFEFAADEGFSSYAMQEERAVSGNGEDESGAGDIELF